MTFSKNIVVCPNIFVARSNGKRLCLGMTQQDDLNFCNFSDLAMILINLHCYETVHVTESLKLCMG